MKYEFDGKTYLIEFKREFRSRRHHDVETDTDFDVLSQYPYTTATIYETLPERPLGKNVYRTATVGCWHKEPTFSLEEGRVRALRLLTRTIPMDMKPLMWKAYHERVGSRKAV